MPKAWTKAVWCSFGIALGTIALVPNAIEFGEPVMAAPTAIAWVLFGAWWVKWRIETADQ